MAHDRAADGPADVVLAWGRDNLRPLPWRSTRDRWAVLVSEVMAQQTGVDRVVPKWTEFTRRWPTASDLAAADLSEVLRLWSGLGYPRRARRLHDAARAIVERHGGRVPSTLAELLALPGVGAYTARAVLAFADERPVGVVDTNVARVLARTAGRRLTPADAQARADELVAPADPWLWNQTLMEIGATLCRPSPLCDACPVAPTCAWRAADRPDPDPARGSAGVSRGQARFEGSDRQARGRLLTAVLAGPVGAADVATAAGIDAEPERARRLADDLVREGLAGLHADGSLVAP